MKSRRKQESHNSTLADILNKNKLPDEVVLYIIQLPGNAELLTSFQPKESCGLNEILKILDSLNIRIKIPFRKRETLHKKYLKLLYDNFHDEWSEIYQYALGRSSLIQQGILQYGTQKSEEKQHKINKKEMKEYNQIEESQEVHETVETQQIIKIKNEENEEKDDNNDNNDININSKIDEEYLKGNKPHSINIQEEQENSSKFETEINLQNNKDQTKNIEEIIPNQYFPQQHQDEFLNKCIEEIYLKQYLPSREEFIFLNDEEYYKVLKFYLFQQTKPNNNNNNINNNNHKFQIYDNSFQNILYQQMKETTNSLRKYYSSLSRTKKLLENLYLNNSTLSQSQSLPQLSSN